MKESWVKTKILVLALYAYLFKYKILKYPERAIKFWTAVIFWLFSDYSQLEM